MAALREFAWSIPDGHVSGPPPGLEFQVAVGGGLGMAIRDADEGGTIVTFLTPGGPAELEGIELKAEILEINGKPIDEAVDETVAWSGPFSTDHVRRLQNLRYVMRSPVGTEVEVTYQNPGDDESTTATLESVPEFESFNATSFNRGRTGYELPVEYKAIEGTDYAYAAITSFADNDVLAIQQWERLMQTLNEQAVPGLVIDMRRNAGGSGFLADQMAAYFFNEELKLGNSGRYDEGLDEFKFDPRYVDQFYLPDESLRYNGRIAVLVGPNCNSACEFFSYNMTREDRAAIVGQYPTAGLGGSVEQLKMPEDLFLQFTVGRAVDENGEIHIEGKGVPPTVQVPVDEETLFSEGDPVLDAAIAWLDGATTAQVDDQGEIALGDSVDEMLEPGVRDQFTLEVAEGEVISIIVSDESGELDTILRLLDLDGNLLVENDDLDDGSGPNSALTELEIPADMTLIVEVGSKDDALEGAYTLVVEAVE
jgi:carboxyl-terminal processing protease